MNNAKIFYTYCITRSDKSDPFYPELDQPFWFGKGNGKRLEIHRKEAKKCLQDPLLPRDIRINIIIKLWEHGLDFVENRICIKLTEEEAFENEKLCIAKYGRINNGTGCLANLTDGGEGAVGIIKTLSEEHKEKLRGPNPNLAGVNNGMYGTHWSEERKRNYSEKRKGIPLGPQSEEHRRKNSESHKGQKAWNKGILQTEEQRRKNSEGHKGLQVGPKNGMYGRKHSEESKEKNRKSKTGQTHTDETRRQMSLSHSKAKRLGMLKSIIEFLIYHQTQKINLER